MDVRAYVWVSSWQFQCCGKPFRTGNEARRDGYASPDAFLDTLTDPR